MRAGDLYVVRCSLCGVVDVNEIESIAGEKKKEHKWKHYYDKAVTLDVERYVPASGTR